MHVVYGRAKGRRLMPHGVHAVTPMPPAETVACGHSVCAPVVALKYEPGGDEGRQKLELVAPMARVELPAAHATVTLSTPPLATEPGQ